MEVGRCLLLMVIFVGMGGGGRDTWAFGVWEESTGTLGFAAGSFVAGTDTLGFSAGSFVAGMDTLGSNTGSGLVKAGKGESALVAPSLLKRFFNFSRSFVFVFSGSCLLAFKACARS